METGTKGMSIKMASEKDLEYTNIQMAKRKQENGIAINYMALLNLNYQVATDIGANIKIIRGKDMGHLTGQTDRDTLGN